MSAYRTPGTGATVPCQRCASIVQRTETEYAEDGSLRCRLCLRADIHVDLQAGWSLRRGVVMAVSWMLAASLTSVLALPMSHSRDFLWIPFAATTALGLVLFAHQLASGRTHFALGLALGAVLGLVLGAIFFLYLVTVHR